MNLFGIFRIEANMKFRYLRKSFGRKPFRLLDIGSGNHSASRITGLFPNCEYYGVDLDKNYNNSEEDFKSMKGFYEQDLTQLNYSAIPDNYFHGIWMVHVIEHLYNGDLVIQGLMPKLVEGGYMYIEYPGQKSKGLPSMHGSLNFYDDETHVRVYSVQELKNIFEKNGFKVIEGATRRNWYYLLGMPFRILGRWVRGKKLIGNIFWDLLGFAEYIYVKKEINRQ